MELKNESEAGFTAEDNETNKRKGYIICQTPVESEINFQVSLTWGTV